MMRKMTVKAMTSPAGVEELVSREYVSMYLKIADTARVQVLITTPLTTPIMLLCRVIIL